MERINYLIGIIIFLIFAVMAGGAEIQWKKSPFVPKDTTIFDYIVAATILAEARGEGKAGMYAVGCVIEQRARNRNIPPANVCRQPKQFQCWFALGNIGGGKGTMYDKLFFQKEAAYAIKIAQKVNQSWKGKKGTGLDLEFVKNADHYHHWRAYPNWGKDETIVIEIGNHVFHKLASNK